jgi:cytochrome P450
MLGVDPADRHDFKRWSDWEAMGLNPLLTEDQQAATRQAGDDLRAYLARTIAARRVEPRDDLISGLIAAEEAGDHLADDEIVTMCELLLAAGNVTTTDLIGNGIWLLLRHPDQLRRLRERPGLLPNAVEEILRFESSVVQTGRIATSDVEIGGCPIRRGESILTLLAAANRDPHEYRDPERFDIERRDVQHRSFGGGAHFCLGAPLARLEAQIALAAFFERFADVHLASEPLQWRALPSFRGLAQLWVNA